MPITGPTTHSSAPEPVTAAAISETIAIASTPRITFFGPMRSASRPPPIAPTIAMTAEIASSASIELPSKSPVRRAYTVRNASTVAIAST